MKLSFSTDNGFGSKARVGLVVLSTDFTIEKEFSQVFSGNEFSVFSSRIQNDTIVTPETLSAMEPLIKDTVANILPGEKLDVVAYGCTSASMVLGNDRIFAKIKEIQPDAKYTTPSAAIFEAFSIMNAKRIAVLTPYRDDVNAVVKSSIENAGFEVVVFGSFEEERDPEVARIDEKSVRAGIREIIKGRDVDLVFVSCTNVRMLNAIQNVETEIGIPVTSSNHAMAWHALRLAGDFSEKPEFGKLFTKQLAQNS